MSPHPARRAPLRPALLALCALGLLPAAPAALGADTPQDELRVARELEAVDGNHAEALLIYERFTANPQVLSALPPDLRADFLRGAARCHEAEGRPDRAAEYYELILGDAALAADVQAWARARKEEHDRRRAEQGREDSVQAGVERGLAERQEAARRTSREREAQAREMLKERRFDDARHLCLEAISWDQDNTSARELLEAIESANPDRGAMLRSMMQFVQTAQLDEYRHIKQRVAEASQDGRMAFERKDYTTADRILRDGIRLIDTSGFLSPGAPLDFESLKTDRATLATWLRQVHEEAATRGLEFPPEPPLPEEAPRVSRLEAQFLDLVAKLFTPRSQGEAPMRFYEFSPAWVRDRGAKPLLTASFPQGGLAAALRPGALTRARWAERWIARTIPGPWVDPALAVAQREPALGDRGETPRILTRFGNTLCVQHRPQVHQRVEAIRDGFAATPPPIRVNLFLFAAGSGGSVRAAEALRATVPPHESGRDIVLRKGLVEEYVRLLDGLPGIVPVGQAEVGMSGENAFALEVTGLTSEDPLFRQVAPPALIVPDEDARSGIWLDVYAEDLPRSASPQARACALGVQVRVRQPRGSHVVPRRSGPDMPFTRLPILAEQSLEAFHELPHFGSFVLFGIENPFPATRADHPEILLLLGVRPAGTQVPDPPRETAPRIRPSDERTRDYDLGAAFTLEVQDDVISEDWPDRRPLADPLPPSKVREARERQLAAVLTQMAGLGGRLEGTALPVSVHDTRASATLSPEDHARLDEAVRQLRLHENELYAVDVLSTVVPRARLESWLAVEGAKRLDGGAWRLEPPAAEGVERQVRANRGGFGLFVTSRRLFARATQQVAHVAVRTLAITKDLRVRTLDGGVRRYAPVPGVAEEGLIVEVRPDIDNAGVRAVYVRARAARLKSIEVRPYPGAPQGGAQYDVPVWFDTAQGSHARMTVPEILDDRTSVLLPLEMPGEADQVIAVLVAVRKAP